MEVNIPLRKGTKDIVREIMEVWFLSPNKMRIYIRQM